MDFQRKSQRPTFESVLSGAGIKIRHDEKPHTATKEQWLVIRDLEAALKDNEGYAGVLLKGLKELCDDEGEFTKSLLPTEYYPHEIGESPVQQDSLIRLLLNVACLQTAVIDMLLEHMLNIVSFEVDDTSHLRLILNALRFLPFLNEPGQLTTKLLDMIEVATSVCQLELLNCMCDVIPDGQYDAAAKQLSKLLEENDDLAGAIIDCLNSFSISAEAHGTIQDFIVDRLLPSTRYYKIFPILFDFLTTDCKPENVTGVLLKTRKTLDGIMGSQSKELESHKVVTMKSLHSLVNTKRVVFDGCLHMIGTLKEGECKPVDVLIALVLYSAGQGKRKEVEVALKKLVKGSVLKAVHFEQLFENYFVLQTFKDYFDGMLRIAEMLVLHDVGALMYKSLFTHKLSSRAQRQDILYNLILLSGKNCSTILEIIKELLEERRLRDHIAQLMGLLERIDRLDLRLVKELFEILCYLTCGADSSELGFKDELHILIRKQLSSFKKEVKYRGIISAVVMAKHMAMSTENADFSIESSINSVSEIPSGPARDAATLLELAFKCASSAKETLGLYYDELSTTLVRTERIDAYLLSWLYENITNEFENLFIVQTVPATINGIPVTSQFSLNTTAEVDDFIHLNIAGLTIQERFAENSNILILAPLFKLLSYIHKRKNENLSTIDALLGCGVVMPSLGSLDEVEYFHLGHIADCVYHCINWFREIISAFAPHNLKKSRNKVITRLRQLVELEQLLNDCVLRSPEHKLPVCCFDNATQTTTKSKPVKPPPRKKAKSSAVVHDITVASTCATQPAKKAPPKLEINCQYRQLDTGIIVLLKYPLDIQSSLSDTQSITLNMKQFQFLVKDFNMKLQDRTKSKSIAYSQISMIGPEQLLSDLRRFIPNINKQGNLIVQEIKALLSQVDDRHEVPELFTDEAVDLKLSLGLVLEFYSLVFGWSGFHQVKHQTLLHECLKATRLQNTQSQSLISTNRLSLEFLTSLYNLIEQCLYLPSAVQLIATMKALYALNTLPEIKKMIVSSSEKLLKKKWFALDGAPETGKVAFENIDTLVKSYLSDADVKTLCGLIGTLQTEVIDLKSRDDTLPMLGSICKSNFHIFYRGLCVALHERVRQEVVALTNAEHLILWRTTALSMQGLMSIVRAHTTKNNLGVFLKKSIGILKVFLSHGVPILEMTLRSKSEKVLEIFKIMQTSTRFLHHLCCYSKEIKNSSLIALVPQFRLTLETLVYRVKAALVVNNCSQAFWMGNLKNKNLEGEDILSQSTINEPEEEEEEELALDSDDEVPTSSARQNDDDDNGSEVFEMDQL